MASTFPNLVSDEDDEKGIALDSEKLLDAARRIGSHGAIPLITAEELAWETDVK